MTEQATENQEVLPIEQRIAALVAHDSIVKMVEEDKLDAGHCTVELKLYNALPEYTPHDFSATNDLEEYLFANEKATNFALTLPFSFKTQEMIRGISANVLRFERSYDCEISTTMESGSIQVELISHKLRRSLYVKMTAHPNS